MEEGQGLQVFKNIVEYVKNTWWVEKPIPLLRGVRGVWMKKQTIPFYSLKTDMRNVLDTIAGWIENYDKTHP